MKKLLIAVVLCGSALIGCTTGETAKEHGRRYLLTTDLQTRTLVDDWDYFWLLEHNSRLSKWNTRIGY